MTTALALAQQNAPTLERIMRGNGDVIPLELDRGAVRPARAQDPLDRYLARGELHRSLYELAREYGQLRWRAELVPRAGTGDPAVGRVDGSARSADDRLLPSEAVVAARRKLLATDRAISRLSGRRRAARRHLGILAAVCAEGHSASAWASANGHRKANAGIVCLRDALRILGKAWGRR